MTDHPWKADAQAALAITVNLSRLAEFDYGLRTGSTQLVKLFSTFAVKATFFASAEVAREHPALLEHAMRSGHEVALGLSRADPIASDDRALLARLAESARAVETVTGERPAGLRVLDGEPPALLLPSFSEAGFAYSSNYSDEFRPYRHSSGLLELPSSPTLTDTSYGTPLTDPQVDVWHEEFKGVYFWGGLATLTLHPHLSGRPAGIAALGKLLAHLVSYPALWNAPLREIARHRQERASGTTGSRVESGRNVGA